LNAESSANPSVRALLQDLCEILTALQQDAPQHSYEETRLQIERSFGHPIEAIFDSFREQPLASASIAQVGG
jgi:predicted unusual protein kinase regulating ubiquinone biosynthesis (AarF/ABC1/UbiB family)